MPKDMAEKVQKFARKYAEKETDKATYQAMEALVHNLNTMHSRAGAQIPFSSIINLITSVTAAFLSASEAAFHSFAVQDM